MHRSRNPPSDLLPEHSAPQHERAPRPLPLFLALVREVSERDPELARQALAGLKAYERAPRDAAPPPKPEAARVNGTCLRDHGGNGPPAVLIPSLINPPHILDLDRDASLAAAVTGMGRQVLLLDWGQRERSLEAERRRAYRAIAGAVAARARRTGRAGRLLPRRDDGDRGREPVDCERVVTLAAPWNFSRYPDPSRAALQDMWRHSQPAAHALGALPMEVLQAAFWSLDPERTVKKFARVRDARSGERPGTPVRGARGLGQ